MKESEILLYDFDQGRLVPIVCRIQQFAECWNVGSVDAELGSGYPMHGFDPCTRKAGKTHDGTQIQMAAVQKHRC